jgi:hypothetical protein
MAGVLQGIAGPGAGIEVSFEEGQAITFGRTDLCQVSIPTDRFMSGRHFEISVIQGRVLLRDLGSSNGTYLNATKIHEQFLHDSDNITAGQTTFRVRLGAVRTPTVVEVLSNLPEPVYAVLDAARDPKMYPWLLGSGAHYTSLYYGKSARELETVAPYLVYLPPHSELLQTLVEKAWSNSWGIFLTSTQPMETIWRELRRSLFVQLEGQEQVYFRFYDPRVLRVFLPIADAEQRAELSGTITSFLMEDEDPTTLLRFHSLWQTCGLDKITVQIPKPLSSTPPASFGSTQILPRL